VINHRTELGHLQKRGVGNAAGIDVFLDGGELRLGRVVVVPHALDAAEDLGEVEGFDGDAL